MMRLSNEHVVVCGAGMSGLIAAYNLAAKGFDVTVRESESQWGGSKIFNPSTHVTPLDPKATSQYIGIDIEPAFHPVSKNTLYIHDYALPMPVPGAFAVERSSRDSSLDALLYEKCKKAGVEFEFNKPLLHEELSSLPEKTVIACGLNLEAYDMLEIPYKQWYGWMSRGEIDADNFAWIWLDESCNEYGYISVCNGIYFNLVFSYGKEVEKDCLERYTAFMKNTAGIEHDSWEYITGAVPLAVPENPSLMRKGFIMCGTISGAMDPLMGFGISGALITGKIAAIAVEDMKSALEEFERFNRNFAKVHKFKDEVWYPLRERVDIFEDVARILGVERALLLIAQGIRKGIKHSAIPGFSMLSCN